MYKNTPSVLNPVRRGGALVVSAALTLFFLMQSRSLWGSPTLVADRWPDIFYPLRGALPHEWIDAPRNSLAGTISAIAFVLIAALWTAAYLWTLRRLFAGEPSSRKGLRTVLPIILAVTTVVLLLFFVVPGMFSGDLFSYISYGRMSTLYGDNPLVSTPGDYAWYDKRQWIQWVVWQQTPSAYGPVWVGLAHVLALLANALDGDIVTHLLAHKALASAAHLVNIILLWKVAGLVLSRYWFVPVRDMLPANAHSSTLRAAVTLTYAWNPLALVEFGISGHNDVLIITCLLGALWLHLKGLWRAAVIAITLGGLIKVTAFIFLPGYLWLLFWEGRGSERTRKSAMAGSRRPLQGFLIAVITCVIAYLPLWAGAETLAHLSGGPAAHFSIHSLGAILRYKVADGLALIASWLDWQPAAFWSAGEIGRRLDWPARWGLLAISGTAAALVTWKARTFPNMVSAWGWALFFYLTIGSVWYWPWYATWVLVPAALYGPGRLYTAVQILCVSSLAVYAVWPALAPPLDWLAEWTGLIVAVPPLAYLGLSAIVGRNAVAEKSQVQQDQLLPRSVN